MQKYLILVNVDIALTGFVPVPDCFELGPQAKVGLALDGWATLVGYLAFEPDEEELNIGRTVINALKREEVDIRD